jgi:hypothetical protein
VPRAELSGDDDPRREAPAAASQHREARMADELIGKAFRRCGNCDNAKVGPETKNDLTQRICYGAPPVPVPLPAQNGIMIRSFHPAVAVNDMACGMWTPKPAHEAQAERMLSKDQGQA